MPEHLRECPPAPAPRPSVALPQTPTKRLSSLPTCSLYPALPAQPLTPPQQGRAGLRGSSGHDKGCGERGFGTSHGAAECCSWAGVFARHVHPPSGEKPWRPWACLPTRAELGSPQPPSRPPRPPAAFTPTQRLFPARGLLRQTTLLQREPAARVTCSDQHEPCPVFRKFTLGPCSGCHRIPGCTGNRAVHHLCPAWGLASLLRVLFSLSPWATSVLPDAQRQTLYLEPCTIFKL